MNKNPKNSSKYEFRSTRIKNKEFHSQKREKVKVFLELKYIHLVIINFDTSNWVRRTQITTRTNKATGVLNITVKTGTSMHPEEYSTVTSLRKTGQKWQHVK